MIKYIVNKENRKIICILEGMSETAVDYLKQIWAQTGVYFEYTGKVRDLGLLPDRFVGIATCSENDEWNEETGKTVAFFRAKQKFAKSFFKHANTVVNYMDQMIGETVESFNRRGKKVGASLDALENKIMELTEKKA